jgi:hypothetical protein
MVQKKGRWNEYFFLSYRVSYKKPLLEVQLLMVNLAHGVCKGGQKIRKALAYIETARLRCLL